MKRFMCVLAIAGLLSGCASYHTAGGGRAHADPNFCKGKDGNALCLLGVTAVVAGVAAAMAK